MLILLLLKTAKIIDVFNYTYINYVLDYCRNDTKIKV